MQWTLIKGHNEQTKRFLVIIIGFHNTPTMLKVIKAHEQRVCGLVTIGPGDLCSRINPTNDICIWKIRETQRYFSQIKNNPAKQ